MITKLEDKGNKIEGKSVICFKVTNPQPDYEHTLTVLEICRNCQNLKNELAKQQNLLETIWAELTKSQKDEYQEEYNKAKGV